MVLAKSIRRLGAVVALLGIVCLLVALALPWIHLEPPPELVGVAPEDYSLLRLLFIPNYVGYSPAPQVLILYLLPVLGACLVGVDGRRAWQGRAATRSSSALLPLSIGCALFGLIASPFLVGVSIPWNMLPPPLRSAGPGASLASLGFGAVVAGGVLLAIGALLQRWTHRHNDRRASATTTG